MSTATLLIIVLIVLLFAGGPYTGWHGYGYWPSGIIGIVLIVVLILLLLGRL
jgi:Protein of unknown function (DUF3309)